MGAKKKPNDVRRWQLSKWNWAVIAAVVGALTGVVTLVFNVWTAPKKETKPSIEQRIVSLPTDAVQGLLTRDHQLYELFKQYGIPKPLLGTVGLMSELGALYSPASLAEHGSLVHNADFLTLTNVSADFVFHLKLDGSPGLPVCDRLGPGETVFVCTAIVKRLGPSETVRYDRLHFDSAAGKDQIVPILQTTTRLGIPGLPGATVGYPPDQRVNGNTDHPQR